MSAETDLRALLVADVPTAALVGTAISADRIEQGTARPFIVFTRTATVREKTLSGAVLGVLVTLTVQCWADTRVNAEAVADAAQAAIEAVFHTVSNREGASDPALDLEAAILTVEWWES